MPPVRFRTAFDDGIPVRVGKIDTDWNKGSTATVTRLKADGTDWDPSDETFEAINHLLDLEVPTGYVKVICGWVESKWVLLNWERVYPTCGMRIGDDYLTRLPGYDAAKWQFLVHTSESDGDGGQPCLKWIDAEECT